MRPVTLTFISGLFAISLSMPVLSSPSGHHDGAHHGKPGHHGKSIGSKPKAKKRGHHFSPAWSKTLSDKQKVAIDKMHLEVSKVEKILRAKIKVEKLELRLLAIQDSANMKSMNKKIEAIAELKTKIMKNRFSHIVEMREILTPEQRISYDMGVLSHKKKKH